MVFTYYKSNASEIHKQKPKKFFVSKKKNIRENHERKIVRHTNAFHGLLFRKFQTKKILSHFNKIVNIVFLFVAFFLQSE